MSAQAAAFERDIHHDPKQQPQKVCVLGGGNFGTAMAFLAASKSHSVRWYCRDAKQAATITSTRRNPRYLSDIELPEGLHATADVSEALEARPRHLRPPGPVDAPLHREISRRHPRRCDLLLHFQGSVPGKAAFCRRWGVSKTTNVGVPERAVLRAPDRNDTRRR